MAAAMRAGGRFRLLQEFSGACGDLGTFIPHAVGAMMVARLAPAGVLFGFAVSLIATGLFYGLPIPVQPMKAVSAVILTDGLRAGEVAGAGLILGVVLVGLGATGAIGRVARLIPQSVLLVLMRVPRCPAAPLTLLAAVIAAASTHAVAWPETVTAAWHLPELVLPAWPDIWRGAELAVLPQLPLTLTNAVIVTASLSRDLFPDRAERTSERNLALSSGIANLLLAPFGAMPMCHGAGGLQAQYRYGARTGLAPILLGLVLLVLALGFADTAAQLFAVIPIGAVGALLIMAGTDLALSRRLFDGRPSCWPVIGVTALVTLLVNPAIALAAGWIAELVRAAIVRHVRQGYS
jgi:hypothetical protein